MIEKQRTNASGLHKEKSSSEKSSSEKFSSIDGRLRLLQVAGGDPAFAAKLREMLWEAYHSVGCPCGASEEGMFRWLMQEEQRAGPSDE